MWLGGRLFSFLESCRLPDFYQDLALRPVSQEIQRLPKKDQFLGCAPSQRDEGVSEEEVGSGMGDGRPTECRMARSTGSGARQAWVQVTAPSLTSSVAGLPFHKTKVVLPSPLMVLNRMVPVQCLARLPSAGNSQ